MDITKLKKQLVALSKKKEEVEYEKKLILNEYNGLKKKVMISGIISFVCLFFHMTVLDYFGTLQKKNVVLYSMNRFYNPLLWLVFIVAFVIFLALGFDWFLNADNIYSIKFAKKMEKYTVREKVEELNASIIRLESAISKIENALYEAGVDDYEVEEEKQSEVVKPSNMVERKIVERTIIEKPTFKLGKKEETKESITKIEETENVDDLLSALDFWDDDEDEFESSSDMWKKDMKREY